MGNLSLYVSGQTEQNDVAEFFQKGLMNAGENPIAFFEGVFYESHQERVGNIAFQDYLIYSDKAVYFWARGSNKDYLDRFDLAAVTVNSRNKDHDFATLNFKIRREGKEPVYVIFDMVELRESELIVRLHIVIESLIEERLGLNYRKALPDDVSAAILKGARGVCLPQVISLRFTPPDPAQQESQIGYGQDLLEQYKASIGYGTDDRPQQQGGRKEGEERHSGGFSPADALKGLENMLPKDPASLKRIAGSIKEMIGDAPFKIRDQLKSDLQHVPGMLGALNELVNSIADNPQAERFVLNIVKTAVRNDGMIGSVGKLIKLSSSFASSSPAKKRSQTRSSASSGNVPPSDDVPQEKPRDAVDDLENASRRKKIHITSDDDATLNDDCFNSEISDALNKMDSSVAADKRERVDNLVGESAPRHKNIVVKSFDESVPSLVKNMMSMDDFPSETSEPVHSPQSDEPAQPAQSAEPAVGGSVTRKKIKIISDGDAGNVNSSGGDAPEKDAFDLACPTSDEQDKEGPTPL